MGTDADLHKYFNFQGKTECLPWYPRNGTRIDLAKAFAQLGFNRGVEVGTHRGHYAVVLTDANPNLKLTCVDPWDAYTEGQEVITADKMRRHYAIARRNLRRRNVELIRKTSMDAVESFKAESLDFVYIDGNHQFNYVMMDILKWVPKVRKGGIVSLHDYQSEGGTGVRKAVEAYTFCNNINPWYVTREHIPTAFWVRK